MRNMIGAGLALGGLMLAVPAQAQQPAPRPIIGPAEPTQPASRPSAIPLLTPSPPRPKDEQPLPGAWLPMGRGHMGLGLFRVPRIDRTDPNRNNPLWEGKRTSRIAAFGMSVRF
jgi:hypothetical protein